jgi:hypothetical protein
MNWGWPQIAYLALTIFGLGVVAANDGKDKPPSQYSFAWTLFSTSIVIAILYFGGFWTP